MLYEVVLSFEPADEILWRDHSNESYWAVLSCGTVYYAVQGGLTFESLGKILKCDHDSNESYWAVLSCGTVYYAVQGGSNFSVCGWKVVLYCGTIYYNAQGGSNSNKSYLKVIMFDFQKWLIGKCGLAAFLILYIYPWISTLKILIKWSLSLMSIAWPPRVRSNLEHGFEIICKYMFTVCDFLHLLDPLVMLRTVQSMTYPTPLTATCGAVSVIPLSLCLTVL